jgi:solute carrier family 25 protein 38
MLHSFIIGALAKTIADTATFPLNLIKTRYESDFYSYKNLSNAFRTIIRTEGVSGLYKGLGATLVRDVGYSGVYFILYTKVKSVLKNAELTGGELKSKKDPNKSVFFATCALTSSMFACCITQPPDVIRSYMQLHPNTYKSFVGTAKIIYAQHGVKGFFAGFLPRSARRVLISMITWTLYEKLTYKS